MAWTEQDYQEIVARLMAESIGVNEVPDAGSTDDISSLPAYQPANGTEVPTVVKASLELLVAPALEAADKANEAADKAESNATAAQTAANTANEKAELAAQAASDATAAKEEAETATQSANNAASNAEEKAEAANTAAQDAEKVANNPTYIGTDHYVYVYNKETDSFDKTGIYCKGEPGSSFRVAGEYATLEALKSAVPDGSAVDGFMAVGTEAPYDYYAWVNGDWVNQGKIAGGGSGNVVVIPAAAMSLSDQATSDEIFNAFGGKQNLIDIIKKVKDEDCVVIAKTDDNPNAVLQQTFSVVNATYVNDNNLILGLASWSVDVTSQMIIQVIDGIASYNEISTPLMTEAPSDGNTYGRKNKDWVEVPEKSDVLTKDNETEYTPTQAYHPATKKYADASSLYKVYDLDLNVIDRTGVLLLWEAEKDEYNATVYRGIMMGSLCTIPLNGITQTGTIPLVSMFASFRKSDENNEIDFIYAKGSSGIRVAPATVIYNNKDYTALQIEVSGEADIKNFVGYFDRPPLLTWVPYLEETGSGEVILNEEINNNIDVSAAKELVGSSDVLTKTNTSAYTPTKDYQPSTKKYVDTAIYGKIINADSGTISNDLVANGTNLTGIDAEERVMRYFGNLANFRSVVQDIVENHTRYFIHNGNDCRELGCLNVWKNTGNTEHELHFILTGFGDGNLHTKRYSIRITENTDDAKFIIVNIVSSDNLKTVTKKSTEEYAAITNKDANTAYCVTD